MTRLILCGMLVLLTSSSLLAADVSDWPMWRGPNGDGKAGSQNLPDTWSESKNVLWRSNVPGQGSSSPIIVGKRLFLTAADEAEQVQSVVCFDTESGDQLWKTDIHKGKFVKAKSHLCSHASCSVACDGERVIATFMNDNAIWTTALDLEGNQVWQHRVCDFKSQFGYGTSPLLYGDDVLIAVDNAPANFVVALNRESGNVVWEIKRPTYNSYVTPVVAKINGRDQLLLSGCKAISGYDPASGKGLWSAAGGAQMAVGSMVTLDDLVFASGGWPEKITVCVKAGTDEIVWQNRAATYTPSMLVHNEYLYGLTDDGIAYCWKADSGEEMWKSRLGGTFRASLTLVGESLIVPNEDGVFKVFKAQPGKLEITAENKLPGLTRATPTVIRDQAFIRTDAGLFCIGKG